MSFGKDRTTDFLQAIQSVRTNGGIPNGFVNEAFQPSLNLSTLSLQNGVSDVIQQPDQLKSSSYNSSNLTNGHIPSKLAHKSSKQRNNHTVLQQRSQFAHIASSISSDLALTCSRLESLSSLARQRTLFDDNSAQVQQLTLIIKEDIASLNHRIADLQNLSKNQTSQSQQSSKHSTSVLMNLQTRLASMSDKFKNVLEHRSATLQAQSARKNEYSAPPEARLLPSQLESHDHKSFVPSTLLQDEQKAKLVADGLSENDEITAKRFAGDQLAQRLLYHDETDTYLASRYDTVRTIEHTIVELGEIFQQLATMVHEQEESVQRIDSNVDDAVTSVEAGHHELLRYFRSVSSNRWLVIKVFAVLLIFFIFFVIFFV